MFVVDRHHPRHIRAAILGDRLDTLLANVGNQRDVRNDAFRTANERVPVRQCLRHLVAHAETGLLEGDLALALHHGAFKLIAADGLVKHQHMPGIDNVLVVLQPVAVANVADGILAPDAHAAQRYVALGRVEDVELRQQRLRSGRSHIEKDQAAELFDGIAALFGFHPLAGAGCLARHLQHAAVRGIEPTMVAAPNSVLLDAAKFE